MADLVKEVRIVLIHVGAVSEGIGGLGCCAVALLCLSHLHADQRDQVLLLGLQVDELGVGPCQLCLQLAHLFLKLEYGTGAAVHGIPDPGVGLVHHAAHGIGPLARRKFLRPSSSIVSRKAVAIAVEHVEVE